MKIEKKLKELNVKFILELWVTTDLLQASIFEKEQNSILELILKKIM